MSRSNHDEFASMPVNSTMQDLNEIDDFSLLDSETERRYTNCEDDYEGEEESEFDDYEDESNTPYTLNTYNELTSKQHFDRSEDLKEMTNITRINNSHKKTLKSFQEKYPISIQLPNVVYYSSTSLNSCSDDGMNTLEPKSRELIENNLNSTHKRAMSKQDLGRIYQELNAIHNKLVSEYEILQEREDDLRKRELKLKQEEERLFKLAHLDAKLRFEEIKLKYDSELTNIRNDLKEKFKENKRLNEAFRSIKQANDSLKQQLNEKNDKCLKQEKQMGALNSRLINLQKKLEFNSRTNPQQQHQSKQVAAVAKPLPRPASFTGQLQQQTLVHNANILEAFAMLLDWLSQVHLKKKLNFNLPFSGDASVIDKSCRLLPLLVELIVNLNNSNITNLMSHSFKKYHLAFLEFIYWSILHCDSTFQNHKINLSSTFRRIGEELYRSYDRNYENSLVEGASQQLVSLRLDSQEDRDSDVQNEISSNKSTCLFALFLQSDNLNVRLLSCLIILRTLTQADYIHNIFEILRFDLKSDETKRIFLDYLGTWTIMKWCKATNKHLLSNSVDTYLQLSIDWENVNKFFDSCSNEAWFSHIALLFKNTNPKESAPINTSLDIKVLEKLSVLLQKLSKIKSNRKYFEMFSLNKICNDLLQKYYYESSFLIMNLKSILFNINNVQSSAADSNSI